MPCFDNQANESLNEVPDYLSLSRMRSDFEIACVRVDTM